MSETFKMVTVVGTSPTSIDEAIRNAITDTSSTLRNLGWFEVQEIRGRIDDGGVAEFQIKIQIGLQIERG